jgi:hypothetical protein
MDDSFNLDDPVTEVEHADALAVINSPEGRAEIEEVAAFAGFKRTRLEPGDIGNGGKPLPRPRQTWENWDGTGNRPPGYWDGAIRPHAAGIVESYDTSVTLRQLFYRLVSDGTLKNTESEYGQLSSRSAEWRREGEFPSLSDVGRQIRAPWTFDSPGQALTWLAERYRRDRTEGQEQRVYIAVEKAGLVAQLWAAFVDTGVKILPLSGYSSETFEREIAEAVAADGRFAVILYAGDFDPSGEDIEKNFREQLERRGVEFKIEHVALTRRQIRQYELVENPGKETDSRAAAFEKKHGGLFQVEVDALPPEVLREEFDRMIHDRRWWSGTAYEAALEAERAERAVFYPEDGEVD